MEKPRLADPLLATNNQSKPSVQANEDLSSFCRRARGRGVTSQRMVETKHGAPHCDLVCVCVSVSV